MNRTRWICGVLAALMLWMPMSECSVRAEEAVTGQEIAAEKPAEAPAEKTTEEPAEEPTEKPTEAPAEKPTEAPTEEPTEAPTEEPTEAPTEKPTEAPTEKPTEAPTEKPTAEPAAQPEATPKAERTVVARSRKESQWLGKAPEDERGMQIPVLYQEDYKHTVCVINGKRRSVASAGCGATCLSMVIAYLTGNTEQDPYKLFFDAFEDGRYRGTGWSHSTLSHYAEEYGLSAKWIENSADKIIEALNEGKPVIAHVDEGVFAKGDHYIVLRGLTEDGRVLINDPASPENSAKTYSVYTVVREASRDNSFMVCWIEPQPEEESGAEESGEAAE